MNCMGTTQKSMAIKQNYRTEIFLTNSSWTVNYIQQNNIITVDCHSGRQKVMDITE